MSRNKKKFDIGNNFDNMFKPTSPSNNLKRNPVVNINIENLVPFKNHPFKLYEGERFSDMIESIKENGIIMPIIVRPVDGQIYEILSGHNRVEAAKSAELESVPVIIREDLNDEEALLIVTETNLIQRSFTDLSHSERATVISVHHDTIKNQGRRTDLINDIENLLKNDANPSKNEDFETFRHHGEKFNSDKKVAEKYALSSRSISRYLRINKLVKELKGYVDREDISILAAVELSYMTNQNQCDLVEILSENSKFKIDIKKAGLLRELSKESKLTPTIIEDILSGASIKKRNRASLPVQSFKLKGKLLSKYFKLGDTTEKIEAELITALEFYRAHNNSNGN